MAHVPGNNNCAFATRLPVRTTVHLWRTCRQARVATGIAQLVVPSSWLCPLFRGGCFWSRLRSILHHMLIVEAICESCLPLGSIEAPSRQAALASVSGVRFTLGDKRMLASPLVPRVAAKTDARVLERMRKAAASAVSMDGSTVNRQRVYNFVYHSSLALVYATAFFGTVCPTGDNLFKALQDHFKELIMAGALRCCQCGE